MEDDDQIFDIDEEEASSDEEAREGKTFRRKLAWLEVTEKSEFGPYFLDYNHMYEEYMQVHNMKEVSMLYI